MELTKAQGEEFLAAAREAVLRAAKVLARWRDQFQVREKGRFDLVTDADLESQQVIQEYLKTRFPDHQFLGEETAGQGPPVGLDSPPTWIVDPIDGTTNYVHDFPFFCISIGLQVKGELVVGVIYEPSRQELFHAYQGGGAWVNDRPLRLSTVGSLNQALLATGFPPNLQGQEKALDIWRHFSLKTQSLRRTGSTALNLAYVAAGRFDGYWAFDNHVWDVAAGVVLVREAGGTITNADGSPYNPYTSDAVASNGPLHPAMLQELGHFLKGSP